MTDIEQLRARVDGVLQAITTEVRCCDCGHVWRELYRKPDARTGSCPACHQSKTAHVVLCQRYCDQPDCEHYKKGEGDGED